MTPDDAFGLGTSETPAGEDPLASIAYEEPEAPEAPETPVEEPAEAAPDETDVAFDEEAQPETEGEEAPEPEPTEVEVEPEGTPYLGRYGEKYKTVEAFEEAHRNALDLQQRQAERARQVETENRQLVEYLRLAGQYIEEQQKTAEKVPATEEALAKEAEEMGVDPETLTLARKIAAEEAASSVAPLQRQLEEQQRLAFVQQQQQATASLITTFRNEHAEELNEDSERAMVGVFNEFGLDPTVVDNYSIALEASNNPQLHTVLRLHPNYIDSDEGMEYARRLAGVHTVTKTDREPELAAARKRATVEGGGSGGMPVGEDVPMDDWDKVLDLAKKERTENVFGISKG
jgi:hypothetical protein